DGAFEVDVERTRFTWRGDFLLEQYPLNDGKSHQALENPKADTDFTPNFSEYDVVLTNFGWKAAPWPEATQKAFESFISNGGGLVVVHAADNSFPEWKEYNEMIGLGGWGGRNEASGPYVYIDAEGNTVRDESKGSGGSHGPKHEYQVVVRDGEHPIMKGLPKTWMHANDELYQKLRGPANNMSILATAYANPKFKGTGRHEPVVMTIDYNKGRVFHTVLGDNDGSMECVGFITLMRRGTEWAATGKVLLTDIPEDFPSSTKVSVRKFGG
ncbi:MAG: ThuA domain-containing protein, partial [Planctomycetota bacterium]